MSNDNGLVDELEKLQNLKKEIESKEEDLKNKIIKMEQNHSIKLFEDKRVRVQWDEKHEKWYFSIIDIVEVLTDSDFQTARNYWKVLKHRLSEEGNQTVTNCNQLKMLAEDGKLRETDVGDTEQILRLVQSSPAENRFVDMFEVNDGK